MLLLSEPAPSAADILCLWCGWRAGTEGHGRRSARMALHRFRALGRDARPCPRSGRRAPHARRPAAGISTMHRRVPDSVTCLLTLHFLGGSCRVYRSHAAIGQTIAVRARPCRFRLLRPFKSRRPLTSPCPTEQPSTGLHNLSLHRPSFSGCGSCDSKPAMARAQCWRSRANRNIVALPTLNRCGT